MLFRALAALAIAALGATGAAHAAKLRTLATIPMRLDGADPAALTNVNGTLYGATYGGGLNGQGAIFTVNPVTGTETVVFSFPAGSPSGGAGTLLYYGGLLYGFNDTTLFSFNPATHAYRPLHVFDGAGVSQPAITLTPFGGRLYGNSCITGGDVTGSLFSYDPASATVTTLYAFTGGADGNCPSGLVAGGNLLYGATQLGGSAANAGTLFSFDPATNSKTTFYTFQNGADGASPYLLIQSGNRIYGMSSTSVVLGQLFSFNPATASLTVVYKFPSSSTCAGFATSPLLPLDGKLYGAADVGNTPSGCGSELYSIDPATNMVATVFTFPASQSYSSYGGFVAIGNTLYGTSSFGGPILGQSGDVFKLDLITRTSTVLHNFVQPDGKNDFTSTLLPIGRLYYGVSAFGGDNDRGALFSFDPISSAITILHHFNGADGSNPHGDLLYSHGFIWGTTLTGGSNDAGAIFSFDPATNAEAVAYSFAASSRDGALPLAGLIDLGTTFYGTTSAGGVHGAGTIYTFHPATQREQVAHAFANGIYGTLPSGPLTALGGILYGTTQGSYAQKRGTLFSFDPATLQETILFSFDGVGKNAPQGAHPYAGVVVLGGLLYGTTSTGGFYNYGGTVFSFDPASNTEKTVYTFNYHGPKAAPGIDSQAPLTVSGTTLLGSTWIGQIRHPGVTSTEFSLDTTTGAAAFTYGFTGGIDGERPTGALTPRGTRFLGTTGASSLGDSAGTIFTYAP